MRLGYLGEPFNTSDTIIIGGGFAGFGAAHTLKKLGINFKLITDEIAGGRNITSKDGKISYGTYFIGDDYHHVRPFVKPTRPIELSATTIHTHTGDSYSPLRAYIDMPIQFLKFKKLANIFDDHYKIFKNKSINQPHDEAIKRDPFLNRLYKTSYKNFAVSEGFDEFLEKYICPMLYAISFIGPTQGSAFEALHWAKYFLKPGSISEFEINRKELSKDCNRNLILDRVTSIKKQRGSYKLLTASRKSYIAKHLIIALPLEVAASLMGLPLNMDFTTVHTYHVKGEVRNNYKKTYNLFNYANNICSLARQHDGTYLLLSKNKRPDFRKYFNNEVVILGYHHWNPAFRNIGPLLKAKQGKNLYLAGDFNVLGIEDSYISGIYAANEIAKSKAD